MGANERGAILGAIAFEVAGAVRRFIDRAISVAYIMLLAAAAVFSWQVSTDRDPPFRVVSVEPAAARPGDTVTIYHNVVRDVSKPWSVSYSRFLWVSGLGRIDLNSAPIYVSPEFIRWLESTSPGRNAITIRVPLDALPGPAMVVTELDYVLKPAHKFWPIHVMVESPFTVLP